MYSLDNFDFNIPENVNILNQEINEQYSIFNNSNFFTLNFNILNQNEGKDNFSINNNCLLSSVINRNMNHQNDFSLNNKQQLNVKNNDIKNKNKKIFFISHQKQK